MQEAQKGGVLKRVRRAVSQGCGRVIELLDTIDKLRVAARTQELPRWGNAAGRNQTVKVKTAVAAITDDHVGLAFATAAEAARQIPRMWTSVRRGGGG